MIRATLTTLMLASVAFVALLAAAPTASATCLDLNPDYNGVGTVGCNVPVVGDCKVYLYGGLSSSCVPIQCFRECGPPMGTDP
jgi:hypothetical protein